MKRKILVLLLALMIPLTAQAVGWRHFMYWWDGIAHILHPSGEYWACDKYGHKCKH